MIPMAIVTTFIIVIHCQLFLFDFLFVNYTTRYVAQRYYTIRIRTYIHTDITSYMHVLYATHAIIEPNKHT